ncbi:MAG: Glycine--tRNA ligase beta subunit [Elusimicrobia bacterium]|nr:Glycine--tRNA ligase beta subunit [Elusimicrobiota bacterium]
MKEKKRFSALLEIGTEEIPARFITDALAQLEQLMKVELSDHRIPFEKIKVYGSPRRLAIAIEGVAPRTLDRTEEVLGPPPKAAKDQSGQWTTAALGFAKAQKVSVEALVIKNTPKGERYVALQHHKGQKTEILLKEIFPTVIKKLTFPKSMIWNDQNFPFVRPIRWLVALYNSQVIRFKLAGVTSDKSTLALLALGGSKINVPSPEKYKTVLQGRCILVDPEDRRTNILNQNDALAKKAKAQVVMTEEHLQEVVHLTEYPVGILGHFPEGYLKLPREVLISVLKKHQKFFPLESSKGQLVNSFIGVRNGPSEAQEAVREGYERVVNARFADAQFFYEKDSQVPLADMAPRLSGVGFHAKLGSMWDKTVRVRAFTCRLGEYFELDGTTLANADRAAFLSKADLLTHLVGEFPELQGVAGRFYAEKQENTEVAHAIEQHYWPLTTEGDLPISVEGALVAVADKMDTLAANFSVGLIPSGSADPYGLRRMSAGVIRILLQRKWQVSLDHLMDLALEGLNNAVPPKVKEDLSDFFKSRMMTLFTQQGFRTDEIEAVLTNRDQSMGRIASKLQAVKSVRGKPEFDSLTVAIKRAGNLLKQARSSGFLADETALALNVQELGDQEKKLCESVQKISDLVKDHLKNEEFNEALLCLSELKSPIDLFFKEVMVMVDDPKLRLDRLGVLLLVKNLFDSVADFSKLQASGVTVSN